MKKILSVVLAVLVLATAMVMAACNKPADAVIPDEMTSADGKYQVAMVTDIGQLKDGSFNEGTWEGVKKAAVAANKAYKYYQPANAENAGDQDRVDAFNLAIQNGAELIVCPGYAFANALAEVVPANPNVKFVFIDGWAIGEKNLTAAAFQEEQCGYLAGYAAVQEGFKKLGGTFGGGSTNAACNRYAYGYIQGINAAAGEKGIKAEVKVSHQYGSGFQASPELQEQMDGWYATGTEVVFACGGSMCQSVFAAAAANNGKSIGVDVDQSKDSATVITSAMKGLAKAVEDIVADFYAGKWDEKLADVCQNMGASTDAVGLPTATWSLKNFTVEQYNKLFADIKAGTVKIANDSEWDAIAAAAAELPNIEFKYE